jgi:cation diffusion facilitator CzcD-associated flavoprotein CzcO
VELKTDVLIVGAGPAGLAVAACLARRRIEHVVIEQGACAADSWDRYYDRLRLHTVRRLSGLPYQPMPARYPRYVTRDQFSAYLRAYAGRFHIAPRTGQEAQRMLRTDAGWLVESPAETYCARVLVMATGIYRNPIRPHFDGMAQFQGPILHSAEYRNAGPFAGQRVLVVGAGNSGAEIALDLADHAAHVALAIRNGVNIVPLDLLGVGIQRWAILVRALPPAVTRVMAPPLLARSEVRQRAAHIPRPPLGVLEAGQGRVPVIGLGLIEAARAGRITIQPGVERFEPAGARFADGTSHPFDAVVLATGFRPALGPLGDTVRLDERGFPERVDSRSIVHPDLFFAGLNYDFAGTLNNIRREAPMLADSVAAVLRQRVPVAATV